MRPIDSYHPWRGPPLLRMPGVRFDLQLAGDGRDSGTLDMLQVPRLRTVPRTPRVQLQKSTCGMSA
jgi:hypothetical protein